MKRYNRLFKENNISIEQIKVDITEVCKEINRESLQKLFLSELYGINIYSVNGRFIKTNYEIDFVEGGHDLVYPNFIPEREIWLDNNLDPNNFKFILFHELIERNVMETTSISYNEAHKIASRYEQEFRNEEY